MSKPGQCMAAFATALLLLARPVPLRPRLLSPLDLSGRPSTTICRRLPFRTLSNFIVNTDIP